MAVAIGRGMGGVRALVRARRPPGARRPPRRARLRRDCLPALHGDRPTGLSRLHRSLSSMEDRMPTTDTAAAPQNREERITTQRSTSIVLPAVYLFRGKNRRVLYGGKAKSIRKRVPGHF